MKNHRQAYLKKVVADYNRETEEGLSYSQQRLLNRQIQLAKEIQERDKLLPDPTFSLCCKAHVKDIRQPKAYENEVSRIKVCTACNTESPTIWMFGDLSKVTKFFIDLSHHRTLNLNK